MTDHKKASQQEEERRETMMNTKATHSIAIRPSAADKAKIHFVDYSRMALQPGHRRKPSWLEKEGLCFIGCWEIMAWRRYAGIATTWAEDDYAFEHSQAFIDDIKKLGCNAVVVPYDCGHGEAFNEPEVELTRKFIVLAHENGLKVGTYFRPDIAWIETLDDTERAEIKDGFQIDRNGRFVQGGFEAAVRMICHHHPGVMARFRRHVQRAIIELKTDILHLDGMIIGGAEGDTPCRCPNCVADFRKFLVERYGHDRELATKRFGHPFLERMEPPLGTTPFDGGPVKPLWCDWVAFSCQSTSRILAQVAAWAQELNPEVMIEINNALPAVRENAALLMGTDVMGVGHYTDASWSEDGYPPKLHADGKLIQRVRQFKLCRAANTFALTYMDQTDERQLRQNLAHTAAFNLGNIGCIGFPPHMNFSNRYNVRFDTKCKFMRWLNSERQYFRGTRSVARIAVWRARENLAMSGKMAYAATMRMEQLLIETCRGFDIVFDESPAALSRYDLVILPNIECMSLDQITGLLDYVRNGGSIFVGQDSAKFDIWHRSRIENPWSALFGDASARNVVADAVAVGVAGVFVEAQSAVSCDQMTQASYGKGRAVYAPLVVDPASQPSLMTVHGALNCGLDYTNWVVPDRADEFNQSLDWLMNGREAIRVRGQRGLLAEFMEQDQPKRQLIHLVNLCPVPQHDCRLTINLPLEVRDIQVLFPPTDTPPKWRLIREGKSTQVVFDFLDVYAVVVMEP